MNRSTFMHLIRCFRRKPFDTSTLEGRHQERYRLSMWASLANFISTGLAMLALVITVPLTLSYLGEERFGVWMTVSSIAAMLSFLDFGVGNGLINRIAAVKANDDTKQLGFVITHGLLLLTLIGVAVGLLLIPLFVFLPWERIIKVSTPTVAGEVRDILFVFLAIFAASIPINGLQKIFQGLQLAWQAHLCRGLGSVLSLVLVYMLARQQAGVPLLLLVTYGMQTGILLLLIFLLMGKKLIGYRHGYKYSWSAETRLLLKTGGLFFLLQIGMLIGWSADPLIISSTLGVAAVTKFALVQRLFQFVVLPLGIINAPLWSAYADAHARNDRAFIKKTLRSSLVNSTVLAIAGVVIIDLLSSRIFALWLKGASDIPFPVVLTYGIWAIFLVSGTAFATFLNGVGEIRIQVVTVLLFCLATLPLKFTVVPIYGLTGLIGVTILTYLVTVALPYLLAFRGWHWVFHNGKDVADRK